MPPHLCLLWTLIVTAFMGVLLEPAHGVSYKEILDLGLNCTPNDTCSKEFFRGRILPSPEERSCNCDHQCKLYDDCCIDAPIVNPTTPTPFACVQMRNYKGIFMITSCPKNWNGDPAVQVRCERTEDESADPVGNLPVTNAELGITYRNIHCATCHKQSTNLIVWKVRLEFSGISNRSDETQIFLSKLFRKDGEWGVNITTTSTSDEFFYPATVDAVVPPQLETKIRVCKPDLQKHCADNWSDQEVERKCRAYQGVLYVKDRGNRTKTAYRNAHCAICNREDLSQLACKSPDPRSFFEFRSFNPVAFSILVDINDINDIGVGLEVLCPEGQVYDVFFKKCRALSCFGLNQVLKGDLCVTSNDINNIGPDFPGIVGVENLLDNVTCIDNETCINQTSPAFTPQFVSCAQVLISAEDFVVLSNSSVYVPVYNRVYDSGDFRQWNNGVFVCVPKGSSRITWKFSPAMGYITVVCLSVSVLFLSLHILFFIIVPDWQNNLSTKNLMSLSVSLLLAYLGFLVAQWHPLPHTVCLFLSAEMFFFYLSSFFWMNVMAYDVWRTLRMATRELRVNSGRQNCRYTLYSIYGWIVPATIVCGAFVFDFTDESNSLLKPQFGKHWCWFGSRDSLLVFFALPLGIMMLANIIFFSSSAWMIASTTKTTMKHTGNNNRNFRLYWKLAVMLGLSWSFAFLASYLNLDTLWYVFVVLNCLKGVFIFVAFTCNGKVKKYLVEKAACLTKRRAYRTSSSGSAYNSNSTVPSTNPAFKTSSTDLKSKSMSSL